ncbi:MAG TPA: hypothetical protein VF190_09995 [Rhodothermales bacterium]
MEASAQNAMSIEEQKAELERQISTLVQEYERKHEGPVELDLSMTEGEGSGGAPEDLQAQVRMLVEAFQQQPVISRSGVRVHKVTAIDSDGDGSIALSVSYDHPGY